MGTTSAATCLRVFICRERESSHLFTRTVGSMRDLSAISTPRGFVTESMTSTFQVELYIIV